MNEEKYISESLDFTKSKSTASHGSYRLQKLTPVYNAIQTDGKLSQSQVSNVVYELPVRVFNLSKSYISFDILFAAETKAANFLSTGNSVIGTLQLTDRSGNQLVSLSNNANNFFYSTALVTKEYNKYAVSNIPFAAETVAANQSTCIGISRTSNSNISPIKYINSADTKTLAVRVHIKLGELAHTLFALDKDLFFGQILTLTVGLAGYDRICGTGAAVGTIGTSAASAPVVSNQYMYLACEVDEDINQTLIAKANSGLSINIPFVYTYKLSQTSTQFTNQVRINSAHGGRILRIYNALMHGTETLLNAYSPPSLTGLTVRSSVNNQWLTDNNLDHTSGEIYMTQSPTFEGSAMMTSSDFNSWWVYIDNFTAAKPYELQKDQVVDGVDCQKAEVLYTFQANLTSSTAVNLYTHVVCQRQLTIQGPSIMLR